jgi:hypothetical protein
MTCRAGCKTQDHSSYADCLRQSGLRVGYTNSAAGWDRTKQKAWDNELVRFRSLESQGIPPIGTTHAEMDRTMRSIETMQKVEAADKAGNLGE